MQRWRLSVSWFPGALVGVLLVAAAPTASNPGESTPEVPPPAPELVRDLPEASYFEDITVAAGVARAHRNRAFENPYAHIMEGYTALGAAVAVADFDGDGWEDLFVTDSSEQGRNQLYRSHGVDAEGNLTFSDVAARAGVAEGNDAGNASANALWFDMDNDGDPDLLVVRFGQNLLFENVTPRGGQPSFRNVTAGSGLERYLNCIVAIAFDYDLDGDLDLFLGNYFAPVNLFDPETPRFFPESFETAANGGGVTVFRNDSSRNESSRNDARSKEGASEGGPRFTDVTAEVGIVVSGWTLDLGHADADHDGDDDLYVAADFGTDSFFRNDGDGTFTDITEKTIGIDTKKGMNVDWGDFDNDGLYDIYVTNITDEYMREGNFLWQNQGNLSFADVARETGTHNTGWGWAGKFFDYDNDGWLDLYVVNGWVSAGEPTYVLDIFELIVQPDVDLADARQWPPMGDKTLSGYQRNSLFHNEGGLFQDDAARHGLDSQLDGRGVAVADFDRDGRLDLFVTNAGREPFLYRNRAPRRAWLQLELIGDPNGTPPSNRDAVGARVWLTADGVTQTSFVNGGNGFASQSSRRLHFGLAGAREVERLRVVWPSGREQTFEDLAADRLYRLHEGGRLTADPPVQDHPDPEKLP